jgi:hypothetical protein
VHYFNLQLQEQQIWIWEASIVISNNLKALESPSVSLKSKRNSKVNKKYHGNQNFYVDVAIVFMKPNNSLLLLLHFVVLVQQKIIDICMIVVVANY